MEVDVYSHTYILYKYSTCSQVLKRLIYRNISIQKYYILLSSIIHIFTYIFFIKMSGIVFFLCYREGSYEMILSKKNWSASEREMSLAGNT